MIGYKMLFNIYAQPSFIASQKTSWLRRGFKVVCSFSPTLTGENNAV